MLPENWFTFGDGLLVGAAISAFGIALFVALVVGGRKRGWW
jgi:hypothetical protein